MISKFLTRTSVRMLAGIDGVPRGWVSPVASVVESSGLLFSPAASSCCKEPALDGPFLYKFKCLIFFGYLHVSLCLSSVLCPLSSVLCPLSSVLFCPCHCLTSLICLLQSWLRQACAFASLASPEQSRRLQRMSRGVLLTCSFPSKSSSHLRAVSHCLNSIS